MKKILAMLLPLLASGVALADPAAAAPVVNKGDNAWLLISSALVILMSIPGLALFYGGLVRKKNVLSILIQVFVVFSLISVLWVVYGYSAAFTEGHSAYNAFVGSFDKILLKGITPDTVTGTFSKGVALPELTFVVFQGAFAAITCALIVGAWAERIKFSAVLIGITAWFTLAYLPVAHMVWFWAGPDAYTSAKAADSLRGVAAALRRQVFELIAAAGETGLTDEEGQEALGMCGNTYRPRRWELEKAEMVKDSGQRRKTRSGRAAAVWVAQAAGGEVV